MDIPWYEINLNYTIIYIFAPNWFSLSKKNIMKYINFNKMKNMATFKVKKKTQFNLKSV